MSTPSLARIQREVARAYGLSMTDLISQRRSREVVWGRHVAMYLCRLLTPLSYPAVGRHFGNRDHTTVMYAVERVAARLHVDADEAARIETLAAEIAAPAAQVRREPRLYADDRAARRQLLLSVLLDVHHGRLARQQQALERLEAGL